MSGPGRRSSGRGIRWLGLGVVVAAVAVAVIVIANQAGSKQKTLPVFVEVPHTTVHADALDRVEAVNKSRYQVGMTSCGVHLTPRASAGFTTGRGGRNCGDYETLAPHARVYLGNPTSTPGKYWVWFGYRRRGSHVVQLAYTKLTVVGPVPRPVSVVLTHSTVHLDETDAVEIVNRGAYTAENTGCSGPSVSLRDSPHFKRPNDLFCAGGAGPSIPPHSRRRVALSISPRSTREVLGVV